MKQRKYLDNDNQNKPFVMLFKITTGGEALKCLGLFCLNWYFCVKNHR